MIRHAIRVLGSVVRARVRSLRSPRWRTVEKQQLREHPSCAACGGVGRLQVHHVRPFHLQPSLELDPSNLLTLCMGKFECHLILGHGDDWRRWNPQVRRDARDMLALPHWSEEIQARAKRSSIAALNGAA